ncbi:MAG: hypothetical protein R3C12_04880 [Planctomycetaceae bacterium]
MKIPGLLKWLGGLLVAVVMAGSVYVLSKSEIPWSAAFLASPGDNQATAEPPAAIAAKADILELSPQARRTWGWFPDPHVWKTTGGPC